MSKKISDILSLPSNPLLPTNKDLVNLLDFFSLKEMPKDWNQLIRDYGAGMISPLPSLKFLSPASSKNNFFSIFRDSKKIFALIDEHSPKRILDLKEKKMLVPIASSIDGDLIFYSFEKNPSIIVTNRLLLEYEEHNKSLANFLFDLYRGKIKTFLPVDKSELPINYISLLDLEAYKSYLS